MNKVVIVTGGTSGIGLAAVEALRARGCVVYALFFYRQRITWWRIILAKLLTNVQNVFLGSLWSAMLYSKGYIYYMSTSAWKNAIYLIPQILLLALVLAAVAPLMYRMRWTPQQLESKRITWR